MYGIKRNLFIALLLVVTLSACSKREAAEDVQAADVPVSNTTDPSLTGDLYASTTAGDALPTSTTTNTTVSQATQSCLAGSQDTLQQSCYDTDYRTGQDLYSMGLGSYASLDTCVNTVRQSLSQFCSSNPSDQASGMKKAEMGLVRCFRKVLMKQRNYARWQPQIQQGYNYSDSMLYLLLSLFQRQQ